MHTTQSILIYLFLGWQHEYTKSYKPWLLCKRDWEKDEEMIYIYIDCSEVEPSYELLMPVIELIKERQFFGSQHLINEIDNVLTCDLSVENLLDPLCKFIEAYNENKTP